MTTEAVANLSKLLAVRTSAARTSAGLNGAVPDLPATEDRPGADRASLDRSRRFEAVLGRTSTRASRTNPSARPIGPGARPSSPRRPDHDRTGPDRTEPDRGQSDPPAGPGGTSRPGQPGRPGIRDRHQHPGVEPIRPDDPGRTPTNAPLDPGAGPSSAVSDNETSDGPADATTDRPSDPGATIPPPLPDPSPTQAAVTQAALIQAAVAQAGTAVAASTGENSPGGDTGDDSGRGATIAAPTVGAKVGPLATDGIRGAENLVPSSVLSVDTSAADGAGGSGSGGTSEADDPDAASGETAATAGTATDTTLATGAAASASPQASVTEHSRSALSPTTTSPLAELGARSLSAPTGDTDTGQSGQGGSGDRSGPDPQSRIGATAPDGRAANGAGFEPQLTAARLDGTAAAQAPAEAGGSSGPDPVWRQVQRALSSVRVTADGDHELTMRLHPEDLGSVTIKVTTGEAGTTIALMADNRAAANQLHQQRHLLAQQLETSGAGRATIDVGLDSGSGPDTGAGSAPGGDARQGGSNRSSVGVPGQSTGAEGVGTGSRLGSTARRTASSGAVDLAL